MCNSSTDNQAKKLKDLFPAPERAHALQHSVHAQKGKDLEIFFITLCINMIISRQFAH